MAVNNGHFALLPCLFRKSEHHLSVSRRFQKRSLHRRGKRADSLSNKKLQAGDQVPGAYSFVKLPQAALVARLECELLFPVQGWIEQLSYAARAVASRLVVVKCALRQKSHVSLWLVAHEFLSAARRESDAAAGTDKLPGFVHADPVAVPREACRFLA